MAKHGLIFDLDGTLVDTPLDFERIRRELGIPSGAPILEAIANGPAEDRAWREARLLELELEAARDSVVIDGVAEFLSRAGKRGLRRAIFTRNAREVALLTKRIHGLEVDLLVAREDSPAPKPDPAGLLHIEQLWGLPKERMLFFGDYLYDLEAGSRAGIPTLLYVPGAHPPYTEKAHALYRDYGEAWAFVETWLGGFR